MSYSKYMATTHTTPTNFDLAAFLRAIEAFEPVELSEENYSLVLDALHDNRYSPATLVEELGLSVTQTSLTADEAMDEGAGNDWLKVEFAGCVFYFNTPNADLLTADEAEDCLG